MSEKIKVLVVSEDTAGVSFFRCFAPHIKLDELFSDEFDVSIKNTIDWNDFNELKKYNIITFNKGDFNDRNAFFNGVRFCKENGIKIVLDLDDYWILDPWHSLYSKGFNEYYSKLVTENIRIADYVTTTTDIFAEKIKKINPNVFVFPNAIDPNAKQFAPDLEKLPSEFTKERKLRIGFVLGSSHIKDMELIEGVSQSLDKEILDKIQFVLCGFDLNGTVTFIDPNTGETTRRKIRPTETSWFNYERFVTNNYKIVSEDYRNFLLSFKENEQYPFVDQEPYRREWTKKINSYATHYDNIDVLFAPLVESDFDNCKSELKMIEAGFKNKAIVMSNVGPYKIGSVNIFEKGGAINPEGNCILIDKNKNHKDWTKAIKKMVNNPELIETMRNNLHKHITKNYDLNDVTKKRAEFYKEILK